MPVSVLLEQIPFEGYLRPTMHRLPPLAARVQEHKGDPIGLGPAGIAEMQGRPGDEFNPAPGGNSPGCPTASGCLQIGPRKQVLDRLDLRD